MKAAALVLWVLTALGGLSMLGRWVVHGGLRDEGSSRLPVPVLFGHFALAAAGLVLWIVYVAAGTTAVAWTAFALLIPVALLGFIMLIRWIPEFQASRAVPSGTPAAGGPGPVTGGPPERSFPLVLVLGHGAAAVATLVVVLVAAIQS